MKNMRSTFILAAMVFMLLPSCNTAYLMRLFENIDLEKRGIHVKLGYVPDGLYKEPFRIPFRNLLDKISDGSITIDSYNIYTVGDYTKISEQSIKSVTNFLDPTSKFKDTWFGVYIIIDDDTAGGRRFMLKNPSGRPEDLMNLNDQSLLSLTAMDQKILVWSSHQKQKNYTFADLNKKFFFNRRKDAELKKEIIADVHGREWFKITGTFDTIAALTDIKKTKMGLFSSIRAYIGLPDEQVYALVEPWHPVALSGTILARYFPCGITPFWAVVYYNGSVFTTKKGTVVDTWQNTDLQTVFAKMFAGLEVDCVEK